MRDSCEQYPDGSTSELSSQKRRSLNIMMASLRAIAIAFNILFLVLIGSGKFSTGQSGAITWGPTHDMWSMAIAISNIEFGLKGNIGYRAVAKKLDDGLIVKSPDTRTGDELTRLRLRQPDMVTRAILDAASMKRESFNPAPMDEGGYVTSWAEDVGYSDFYNIAFRVFGYSAYSTHQLYILIISLSAALFVVAFWRDNIPVALLTFSTAALFMATTSTIFTDFMPSIAANRFLSTLAIIPLLHIMCATIDLRRMSVTTATLAFLQTILMLFAIRARASAMWGVLAYEGVVVALLFLRPPYYGRIVLRWCRPFFYLTLFRAKAIFAKDIFPGTVKLVRSTLTLPGILLVPLIVAGSLLANDVITRARLDPVYFTDDVMPHHFVWHPAFISLALHPKWHELKPYRELPDIASDELANAYYEIIMSREGLTGGSPVNNWLSKSRKLDRVIRGAWISFVMHHPIYMVELIGFYKPRMALQFLTLLARSIPTPVLLLASVAAALGTALFFGGSPRFRRRDVVIVLCAMGVCVSLPPLWAWSNFHTLADQLWAFLFLPAALIGVLVAWAFSRLVART
jgi:hypothetical protein